MEKEHKVGEIATSIEKVTGKVPFDMFLWTSISAMGTSLCFKLFKKDHMALFIGQWTAPFLLLGVYNKVVKVEKSDTIEKEK